MAQSAATRSDLLEQEYADGLAQVIRAALLLLGCLILVYLFSLVPGRNPRVMLMAAGGLASVAALAYGVMGGLRMQRARSVPAVTVNCPYCDYPMEFLAEPTEDWVCEGCHRRVHYENGRQVPIKMITCPFCKTVHKVSAKARQYTCDRCNRALKLTDGDQASAVVAEQSELLRNYDVLLTQVGRNPTEVALALESILVCNLREARARMQELPLTIARNVPERKAAAIRSRMRELGATAVMRPTEDTAAPRR